MPPATTESRDRIYIPSECTKWDNADHLASDDFPIQNSAPLQAEFPFSIPILFGTDASDDTTFNAAYPLPPTCFAARQLITAPRITGGATLTRPALAVERLFEQGLGLEKLYRSREMWDLIKSYSRGPGQPLFTDYQDPTVSDINGRRIDSRHANVMNPPVTQPVLNTNAWDHLDASPLSEPGRQANSIFSLYDHWNVQLRRPPPIVNSESAVASEFMTQFAKPVNLYLEVRVVPLCHSQEGQELTSLPFRQDSTFLRQITRTSIRTPEEPHSNLSQVFWLELLIRFIAGAVMKIIYHTSGKTMPATQTRCCSPKASLSVTHA